MNLYAIFLALQLCDATTTLLFLRHGVAEANPLVRTALRTAGGPALGLLLVKAAACGLGLIAWRSGRLRLLRRANLFFALCVVWNMAATALG